MPFLRLAVVFLPLVVSFLTFLCLTSLEARGPFFSMQRVGGQDWIAP